MVRHRWDRLGRALLALSLIAPGAAVQAQQGPPVPPSGFRPESPLAAEFMGSLDAARIAVLPTIVRGTDGVTYSLTSQDRILEGLAGQGLGMPVAIDLRVDLGALPHRSQWEIFHGSLETLARALDPWPFDAEYALAMEVALPPGEEVVFGIETYVVDREGRNAFSFLLNAHHPLFQAAHLVRADATAPALEAMILEATRVGVLALNQQVVFARECAAWMASHPARTMKAGVFENFEAGLPTTWDPVGIPLGFSTFGDGRSTVRIETTEDHPPRDGELPGNTSMRIDAEVGAGGWAGFAYLASEAINGTWQSQDWTGFQGIRFWLFGSDSGTQLFVDVLDNRNPCSRADDAERYVYVFTDDFSGWREIVVPFGEMVRKEVGNGAPDDGLGLNRVHGWAFGATATDGPRTWYLDDVALWSGGG